MKTLVYNLQREAFQSRLNQITDTKEAYRRRTLEKLLKDNLGSDLYYRFDNESVEVGIEGTYSRFNIYYYNKSYLEDTVQEIKISGGSMSLETSNMEDFAATVRLTKAIYDASMIVDKILVVVNRMNSYLSSLENEKWEIRSAKRQLEKAYKEAQQEAHLKTVAPFVKEGDVVCVSNGRAHSKATYSVISKFTPKKVYLVEFNGYATDAHVANLLEDHSKYVRYTMDKEAFYELVSRGELRPVSMVLNTEELV